MPIEPTPVRNRTMEEARRNSARLAAFDVRPPVTRDSYMHRTQVRTTIIQAAKPVQQPPQPQVQSQLQAITVERTKEVVDEIPTTQPSDNVALSAKQVAIRNAVLAAKAEYAAEERKKNFRWRIGMISTAVILVGLTSFIAIDTWRTNAIVKAGITAPVSTGTETVHTLEQEGQDESAVAPSAVGSYTVAPDAPRVLTISKLKVNARILPMTLNANSSIQAPLNVYDAGWYTGSSRPGSIGATFIDGHASGPTREGLFAYLDTLVKGDELTVEMGNGDTLKYRVVHVEEVPLEGIDMRKVLLPHGTTQRGLNLMTCTGKWLEDKKTYDQRVVVYTEQI